MLTNTRSKKIKKQADVSDREEDMLSNLPEGIITHILSFLSTMESVRTSILSTRWKYIWSSVPTLDLRYREFHYNARGNFWNVVDRLLMGHNLCFLDKVYIDGLRSGICDGSRVESGICAAIKRNVRLLQLEYLSIDLPHELHQNLFSCNVLVALKLRVDLILNFPMTSTCFPNLRVLELDWVIYKDDTSAQNLISSCPILEDLVILRNGDDNSRSLNVNSRQLKKLVLRYTAYDVDNPVQIIMIDAPALKSLYIEDNVMTQKYVVRDLASIISVKLHVSDECYRDSDSYETCLFEPLIKSIFNVKFLRLSCCTMNCLSHLNSYNLPTFRKLTYLKFFDIDCYDGGKWKMVMEFLKNSPILEVLIFNGFHFTIEEQGTTLEWDVVPNCFISHLKTIKIRDRIDEENVEKVRYFLKNAKVLEKFITKTYNSEILKKLKIDYEDIFMHPRGSITWSGENLVISFV